MAYELRYKCGFSSSNQSGWVYIYEDDYDSSAGEEELTTKFNSVKVKYNWKGWEDPVIGLTASFTIVNDKDDFFDLLPLLTAEERHYWVKIQRVTPDTVVMFEGFLNCEDNEQKYLKRQDIRLNASSYLSKLQYVKSPTVAVLETDSFINIIDDCLLQTGSTDNIRVNCSLIPEESLISDTTRTAFNLTGVYKEVFWKNNVDQDSALDVIKKILTTFNCYIYWYNGYWYIERYADIWNNPQNYVEYTAGTSAGYNPGDFGIPVQTSNGAVDFKGMIKLGQSQVITMVAGQKLVEIDVEQQLLFNLIVNNFVDVETIHSGLPYPDLRSWQVWEGGSSDPPMYWTELGEPHNNIAKAIRRNGHEGSVDTERGMYTRFKTTISG